MQRLPLLASLTPVKTGLRRRRGTIAEIHASKRSIPIIRQVTQLLGHRNVEELALVLQHAAEKLPRQGARLERRVEAADGLGAGYDHQGR